MANYDVMVQIHHTNSLPEDDVVNTLHYDVNVPDTLSGTSDDIATAYQGLIAGLLGGVNGITIKWYEPGLNPGGAVFTKHYTTAPYVPANASGPREVAVCLSYATTDDPEAATPRRRGRIYCGPIASSRVDANFVSLTYRNVVLDFGVALAAAGNAGNTTWKMHSRVDNEYLKIESIWCDNAWDTQRRRGLKPTFRTSRDVQ